MGEDEEDKGHQIPGDGRGLDLSGAHAWDIQILSSGTPETYIMLLTNTPQYFHFNKWYHAICNSLGTWVTQHYVTLVFDVSTTSPPSSLSTLPWNVGL